MDREKVIKALHCRGQDLMIDLPACDGCDYQIQLVNRMGCDFRQLCRDALSLLKEQEAQKFLADEDGKITPLPIVFPNCPLKEQEAVEPVKKDMVEITARYEYDCPCGAPLLIGQPYCADCGRMVKWE